MLFRHYWSKDIRNKQTRNKLVLKPPEPSDTMKPNRGKPTPQT